MIQKEKLRFYINRTLWCAKRTVQILFLVSLFFALLYRRVHPPITPLMVIRFFDQLVDGRDIVFDRQWVDIQEVSPNVVYAIVAGEDNKFLSHAGFDFDALYKALEYNLKHNTIALWWSTISQQTAKNVFLWPGRDYLRKWLEAYFTLLIESFRDKERILEVYVNVIEFGDGVYGIQAAAQKYFHVDAKKLTSSQASLLAAVLPNPRYYEDHLSSYRLMRRKNSILNTIGSVKRNVDNREFVKEIKN